RAPPRSSAAFFFQAEDGIRGGHVTGVQTCALPISVAIQAGMAERERDMAPERRIAFRMGINLGDIVIDGEDIYGDGVNIAARLRSEERRVGKECGAGERGYAEQKIGQSLWCGVRVL